MDTSIDNLIKSISDSVKKIEYVSDSIKKKDEEIASLETDLETYEDRIKKLEDENKRLQCENSALKNKIIALENSNDAYTQVVIETLGEIPSSIDAFKESINKRIEAAYKDGFREAQGKYNRKESRHVYTIEQIVTEIFGSNPEIKTFDDMRYIIEQNRSEAYNKGLKTGKEVIFGNIYKYIVKEFNK